MNENSRLELLERGVTEGQLRLINDHVNKVQKYIVKKDVTFSQASSQLIKKVKSLVTPYQYKMIMSTFDKVPEPVINYSEEGLFDSAQASREASKVLSNLLSAGRFISETEIMDKGITACEISKRFSIDVSSKDLNELKTLPKAIPSDLLFPGITPSKNELVDIEKVILTTLLGHPPNSVRLPFGVGGLRFDRHWNYQMTILPYTIKKIEEDKRVYPGAAVLYFLLQDVDCLTDVPLMHTLQEKSPDSFGKLQQYLYRVKSNTSILTDKSNLCAAYIPTQDEIREAEDHNLEIAGGCTNRIFVPLYRAFRTPSDIYRKFLGIMEFISKDSIVSATRAIDTLPSPDVVYNFNGIFHLPWVKEAQCITDELVGRIYAKDGRYVMRYGIGHKKYSKEFQIYHLSEHDYAIKCIDYSDMLFSKKVSEYFLSEGQLQKFEQSLQNKGFLLFMHEGGNL